VQTEAKKLTQVPETYDEQQHKFFQEGPGKVNRS